jgi:hypothetical protein
MVKLLLLVAALFLVVAVLRVFITKRSPDASTAATPEKNTAQTLLPCPHCGVHMAADELPQHQASHRL